MDLNKKYSHFLPLSLVIVLTWLAMVSCTPKNPGETDLTIVKSDASELNITVELAITRAEKRTGLAHRDRIKPEHGMLYIYGTDKYSSFTMRGARIDLSAAYIDSAGTILETYNMIIDPNTVFRSSEKCRYVLQVPYGWFELNGIYPGDILIIPDEIKRIKPLF